MFSSIITLFFSIFFGLFGFSQIIYPLFQAWPKAALLQKKGIMKQIPVSHFIVPPIVWIVLITISVWIVSKYIPGNLILYLIVLGVMLIVVIVQMFIKNPNLDRDFYESYGKYLNRNQEDISDKELINNSIAKAKMWAEHKNK